MSDIVNQAELSKCTMQCVHGTVLLPAPLLWMLMPSEPGSMQQKIRERRSGHGVDVGLNDEGRGSFHKARGIHPPHSLSVSQPHWLAVYNCSSGAQTPINSRAIKQSCSKNTNRTHRLRSDA